MEYITDISEETDKIRLRMLAIARILAKYIELLVRLANFSKLTEP